MARLRSAPTAPASPPKAQSKRQALKEKTNVARAKAAQVDEDVGNIEGLVKENTKRKGRPRKSVHNADELVMAGGLGQKEADVDAPRSELEAISTDDLAKSDAPAPPTAKRNKRPPRMTRRPIQTEAQSKVLEGLKRRREETARKEVGRKGALPAAQRAPMGTALSSNTLTTAPVTVCKPAAIAQERSEYDIEPSPPPPGKLSSVKKRSSLAQQTSSLKPQSTPAMDTSVLKNFKRRARQPSMLAVVQQRTMSARPSLANATAAEEDPSIFDFDGGDGEDEDDFAPEAEGTPLHVSKAKRKPVGSASKKPAAQTVKSRAAPQAKKRKSNEAELSSGALETLRAKRRKSDAPTTSKDDDTPLPEFQREPATRRSSTATARQPTPMPRDTSDVQVINSSQSTTPPAETASPIVRRESLDADFAVPSTERQYDDLPREDQVEQHDDPHYGSPNGTRAEPASSSPVPDALSGTQQRLRDELADPVTQLSPKPVKQKPKDKSKPMSTATLQNLLPKRRQRLRPRHRKSEYDFVSESEDEGERETGHFEDEGDELDFKLRRQTKTTPAKGRKSTVAAGKWKGRQSKVPQHHRKSSAPPPQHTRKSSAAPRTKKPTRMYGRAAAPTTSDKENDADGFETLDEDESTELPEASAAEVSNSNELEAAKRRFAEVDEWDMEFESLGDEDHRSSSQQWR